MIDPLKNGKKDREVFNIGMRNSISINEQVQMIQKITGKKIKIKYIKQNDDEIKFSVADVRLAQKELGFIAKQKFGRSNSKKIQNCVY